jgi:hypothetical protein
MAVAVVVTLPVLITVVQAVQGGASAAKAAITASATPTLLLHTLELGVIVTPVCGVLGVAAAWVVERARVPGRRKSAAERWLAGLKQNGQTYQDDEAVVAAVNRGDVAAGIINREHLGCRRARNRARDRSGSRAADPTSGPYVGSDDAAFVAPDRVDPILAAG